MLFTFSTHADFPADRVFIGGESGVLRQLARDADGNWTMQQLWQGTRPIRQLAAAPRGNYLVLVDDTSRASQFILAEGNIGEELYPLSSKAAKLPT